MASTQRADRFEQLYKALKKHYKHIAPPSDRKVLDHLMYACCLEDASYEAADEAFAKLQQTYFDANEIRVTTAAELSECFTSLPKAASAANRIKKSLQSMFEARYSFEIEDLKKANLGKAIDEIKAWQGVSSFVVDYLTQYALGGHAIPVSSTILDVCLTLEIISFADVDKGVLPGVERAIAKNKGLEFASMLHQLAIDFGSNFKHPISAAVFKDMGVAVKPRPVPPPPPTKSSSDKAKLAKSKEATAALSKPAVEPKPVVAPKATKAVVKPVTKKPEPEVKSPPTKPAPQKMVSKPVAPKKSEAEPKAKTKAKIEAPSKPVAKSPANKTSKPDPKAVAKPLAKKASVNKSSDKKGPAAKSTAKPASKSSAGGSKAKSAKRLPVAKPVTSKKTKPK